MSLRLEGRALTVDHQGSPSLVFKMGIQAGAGLARRSDTQAARVLLFSVSSPAGGASSVCHPDVEGVSLLGVWKEHWWEAVEAAPSPLLPKLLTGDPAHPGVFPAGSDGKIRLQ